LTLLRFVDSVSLSNSFQCQNVYEAHMYLQICFIAVTMFIMDLWKELGAIYFDLF